MNAVKVWKMSLLPGLVLGMIWLGCCSPLQKKRRLPGCRTLHESIKANWTRDAQRGVYVIGAGLSESGIRDGSACIEGLLADEVQRLFGTADTLVHGMMVYYLAEPCLEPRGLNVAGCHYMGLRLDAEGKAVRVEFVTVSGEF